MRESIYHYAVILMGDLSAVSYFLFPNKSCWRPVSSIGNIWGEFFRIHVFEEWLHIILGFEISFHILIHMWNIFHQRLYGFIIRHGIGVPDITNGGMICLLFGWRIKVKLGCCTLINGFRISQSGPYRNWPISICLFVCSAGKFRLNRTHITTLSKKPIRNHNPYF